MRRAILTLLFLLPLPSCAASTGAPEPDDVPPEVGPGFACNCDAYPQPCCCTTPVIVDVAGDGVKLTSWQDGVIFNLVPWYGPSYRAWTEPGSDDAWLFLDSNSDGVVTDGTELFGDVTIQPDPADGHEKNGFLALAQHDENGDSVIDKQDWVFDRLRLWQDQDHDGASQPDELHRLADLGVQSLSVKYTPIYEPDGQGNVYRYSAAVTPAAGSPVGMTAWDVTLTSPTGKEREAYGLPEPEALPDPQDPSDVPVFDDVGSEDGDMVTLTKKVDDGSFLPPQVCTASLWQQIPSKIGYSAFTTAVWAAFSPTCPVHVAAQSNLYNKYQGTWRAIHHASNPSLAPATQTITNTKYCNFVHATIWYADFEIAFGPGWLIPTADFETDASILQCSAFAKPATCY